MIEVLQQQARKTSGPAWGWGEVSGTAPLRVLYQGVQLAADQLADADKWAAALTIGDKVAVLPNREDGQFAIIRPGETDCAPADHDHDSDYLGKTDKAADADKLDGKHASAFAAAAHPHGNLTSDGKVGSTAGLPLKTGTAGVVEAGAFGTGSGQFAEGNHDHGCPYEIGDILVTIKTTSPADRWPGTTWTQLKDRILIGAGNLYTVGTQVGGLTHTHPLSASAQLTVATTSANVIIRRVSASSEWDSNMKFTAAANGSSNTGAMTMGIGVQGSATEESHLPPVEPVLFFKRTA
jgi:hypothetical protein